MCRLAVAVTVAAVVALAARPAPAIDPAKPLGACQVGGFGARDGLPGWVRAVVQSADGYLWIGTTAGLHRYGGGAIHALAARGERTSLDVFGLLAARDGRLWVAPSRGAPLCLHGERFAPCLPPGVLAPTTRVSALHEDAAGVVWIGASEGLLAVEKGVPRVVVAAAQLPFERILALHADAQGRILVGSNEGLHVLGVGAAALSRYEIPGAGPLGAVVSMHAARGGALWIASDAGLVELAGAHSRFFGATAGFPGARPNQIRVDRDDNVWFGSRRGLTRFRPGAAFITFTHVDGLPEDDVTTVFEDAEGGLWAGTRGGGLAQFTDRTLDGRSGPPSLVERWINAVAADSAGALWLATRTGLVRWQGGREASYGEPEGLPSANVLSLAPASDGALWVGTEAGLALMRDGRVTATFTATGAVYGMLPESDGTLFVGTARGLLRQSAGGFAQVPIAPGVELGETRGIARDDQGTLWLAAGGRLVRLVSGRLELPPEPALSFGKVRALARDGDGTLWLATGDGLVRGRQGAWRRYGVREGLLHQDLEQVVDDGAGFLWVGGTHGVVRIARASLTASDGGRPGHIEAVTFPTSDRRRGVDVVRGRPGAFRGGDGRLWFATSRGVVSIDPARVRVNRRVPAVLIERAFVDGRPAHRGGSNVFPPGSGALELHFAAITLFEPQRALHRYRLEGFDRDWIDAGTRRVAYYTNIPPGQYRFAVQGSNADGVWNQHGDVLALELRPRFTETWWFYALMLAGAAGLALAIHRMRVAHVHSGWAATFAERNRVARELHDSLLQGMAGLLLHMRGLRKRLARRTSVPTPEMTGEIAAIEALVGASIEDTRRLVWDLRESSGDRTLDEGLAELVARLRTTTTAALTLTTIGTPTPLARHVCQELGRIAQEAVSNAIKHAHATRIELRVCYEGGIVKLSVVDDGRGFEPAAAPGARGGHFGLMGLRERAAGLGALDISSQPGQGTRVEIVVDARESADD